MRTVLLLLLLTSIGCKEIECVECVNLSHQSESHRIFDECMDNAIHYDGYVDDLIKVMEENGYTCTKYDR